MFGDRWRLPRAESGAARTTVAPRPAHSVSNGRNDGGGEAYSRHSNGLEQFFDHIQGEQGLNLLDFSGVSQANVGFITNMGCKLYSEDLIQTLDFAFGAGGDSYENQSQSVRIDEFVDQNFNFEEGHLDGVLLWDVLEFVAPALLKAIVERLRRAVKPGSYLLAMFHAGERAGQLPVYSYRISDAKTLLLTPRGLRDPAQFFNNRAVENLFQGFESVKFFLSRDSLREVIVKR
ncbi:MAG TPA: class I SAM-dependent methyltransferase [Bryobacteraceae bacterium]